MKEIRVSDKSDCWVVIAGVMSGDKCEFEFHVNGQEGMLIESIIACMEQDSRMAGLISEAYTRFWE